MIRFELPFILPTLNVLLRTNRWREKRHRVALAWEVKLALGKQMPAKPLGRVWITIERHSTGVIDPDGLSATAKPLLDILQPTSKRHPTGIGVITNDSPEWLTLAVSAMKAPTRAEQKTVVTIEEML